MPLKEDEKAALLELSVFKSFKKGTVLLSEGQMAKEGYFVLKGCIRVYYNVDGEERTTEFYTEAEALSPTSLIHGQPSAYYIACVEDCILIATTPDTEAIMFEKFPRFETLCRILSEKLLAKSQASFDEFKLLSPEQRYINLLDNRPMLLQRVPQRLMASYLGITPQSLSRMRGRLARKK